MPQRFLRPGITTSQRFNSVTFPAQSFYVRLITLVDDFGLYEADFRLLRSHVFPFGDHLGKDISLKTVEDICEQLSAAGLVLFYRSAEKKPFLQIMKWNERVRVEKSKYQPYDEMTCEQMFANDNNCKQMNASLASISSPAPIKPSPSFLVPADADASLAAKFDEWMKFRKGLGKKPANWTQMFSEQWNWIQQFGNEGAVNVLSQSIRNGWQGLFELKEKSKYEHSKGTLTESSRNLGTQNAGRGRDYENAPGIIRAGTSARLPNIQRTDAGTNGSQG